MSETFDETLAHIDAVIENWETGPDAAQWAADGSHEHDPARWTTQDPGGGYPSVFRPTAAVRVLLRSDTSQVGEQLREIFARMAEAAAELIRAYEGVCETLARGFQASDVILDETREWRRTDAIRVPFEVDGRERYAAVPAVAPLTPTRVAALFDVPEDLVVQSPPGAVELPARDGLTETAQTAVDAVNRRTRRKYPA